MFSSLQDALKKLRETRQNEQSQPKRVARAPETGTPSNLPQPRSLAAAEAEDMDNLDVDLDGVDLFEDLIADDAEATIAAPAAAARQPAPPQAHPATNRQQTTSASSRTALPHSRAAAPPNRSAGPGVSPTPTNSRAPLNRGASFSTPHRPQRQGSAASQTDMFTTPRHDGRTNSSANRTMITTTVVGQRGQRAFVSGAKRQKIPGPAGLIETSVASGAPSTQKPTSPFRTPLSRCTHSEQSSNVDFEGGTWAAMLDHLHLPAYTPATAKTVTRTAEAAEWPIRRVLEATHTQRVRIMLVQLREMGSSDADASVSLVDPTGEMRASIHRPVMKRFVHFLAAGTSIILKDVVALKLPGVQPFLTITAASIEQIFTSKGAGTSENPIMLTATQAPADTPTQAPADRLEPAVSDSSPPALPSQADKRHGASDGEPDLLGSSGFLDNEDEDAFSDLLDPSQ